jgi:hypothetical protein
LESSWGQLGASWRTFVRRLVAGVALAEVDAGAHMHAVRVRRVAAVGIPMA